MLGLMTNFRRTLLPSKVLRKRFESAVRWLAIAPSTLPEARAGLRGVETRLQALGGDWRNRAQLLGR